MKRLVIALALVAACAAPPPESTPDGAAAARDLPAPAPLRRDCYDSTVPPELAPAAIRDLPQC